MKKNYFFVLAALLLFALCSYAQDDTTQDETYNMTVKLPDGTTLTVNTDDVDEVTFSNGTLIVTGTRIDEIVAKLKQIIEEFNSYGVDVQEAKAYIEKLVADFKDLQYFVDMLKQVTDDNMRKTEDAFYYAISSYEMLHNDEKLIEANQESIKVIWENIAQLQADMANLQTAIASIRNCSCADLTGQLAALEAETDETRALAVEASQRAAEAQVTADEAIRKIEDAYMEVKVTAQAALAYVNDLQTHIVNLNSIVANQNDQIATLQEEVEVQKEKNAALEERVAALEAMMKVVEEKLDWQLGVKEQKND